MTIELPTAIEGPLRGLAESQGRDVVDVVVELLRQHIELLAITDLDSVDVGRGQVAMLHEIVDSEDWEA